MISARLIPLRSFDSGLASSPRLRASRSKGEFVGASKVAFFNRSTRYSPCHWPPCIVRPVSMCRVLITADSSVENGGNGLVSRYGGEERRHDCRRGTPGGARHKTQNRDFHGSGGRGFITRHHGRPGLMKRAFAYFTKLYSAAMLAIASPSTPSKNPSFTM